MGQFFYCIFTMQNSKTKSKRVVSTFNGNTYLNPDTIRPLGNFEETKNRPDLDYSAGEG